jgi:hypothetical protein
MLASCRPQPNWIPRNPKFMLNICGKLSRGRIVGWEKELGVGAGREELEIKAGDRSQR